MNNITKTTDTNTSEIKIKYFKDGNEYCAVYDDFQNLHESPSGFGKNPEQAITNLFNEQLRLIIKNEQNE